MPRTKARVDANQAEIVQALRQVGASVCYTHMLGQGVPDLLIGYRGVVYLLEVKDGRKSRSRRQLTEAEAEWHAAWRGRPVDIVESVDDALRAIGAIE